LSISTVDQHKENTDNFTAIHVACKQQVTMKSNELLQTTSKTKYTQDNSRYALCGR